MLDVSNFDRMRIGLASPEQIESWSHGEVKKPETINYRTLKPERDGLFCERIFGPTRDWECHCGKYKRVRYKGIVCDRCGVEVTRAKVRRERLGHIKLATPVSHIWYFKGIPSRMGLLLDVSPRNLEKVLYFVSYIVLDPGEATDLVKHQLLSEGEYREAREQWGDAFEAGMGAEAVKKMLQAIDLEALDKELSKAVNEPLTEKPMSPKGDEKKGTASDEYRASFWARMRSKSPLPGVLNALQIGDDSEGGYLVPDEYERTLIDALQEENMFRQLANIIRSESGDRKIPVVASHGTASWIDEEGIYPESDDTFAQLTIGAHKYYMHILYLFILAWVSILLSLKVDGTLTKVEENKVALRVLEIYHAEKEADLVRLHSASTTTKRLKELGSDVTLPVKPAQKIDKR